MKSKAGTLFRYGLPLSFLYCTVYQQNIWREGDEKLIEEQKCTWRKFFNLIDNSYHQAIVKLNLVPEEKVRGSSLVSKLESWDVCWNTKVLNFFALAAESSPEKMACKVYRMVAETTTTSNKKAETPKVD